LGHLLRRAFYDRSREKGYILPVSFKQKWISYQQKEARGWRYYPQYGNDLAQAYRLYTLALAGSPDLSSMNRMRETQGISNESKLRLALAHALAGQKSAGELLLAKTNIDEDKRPNYYDYYYGSPERNRAMTLEPWCCLAKNSAHLHSYQLAKSPIVPEWMSTQTTAYSLYAMSKFAKSNGSKGIEVQYQGWEIGDHFDGQNLRRPNLEPESRKQFGKKTPKAIQFMFVCSTQVFYRLGKNRRYKVIWRLRLYLKTAKDKSLKLAK
jgi:hypothetical protein